MIDNLRVTLIADGSSDKSLCRIIKWVLDDRFPTLPSLVDFADFRRIYSPPEIGDVAGRIAEAKRYYPFDLLVYHRDAEGVDREQRRSQILRYVAEEEAAIVVCCIPVRMMETWLLIDDLAIKKASGNRYSRDAIGLPGVRKLESVANPKRLLHDLIKGASGKKGRALERLNVHEAVHLVAEYTNSYHVLRQLNAFVRFEEELCNAVEKVIHANV